MENNKDKKYKLSSVYRDLNDNLYNANNYTLRLMRPVGLTPRRYDAKFLRNIRT